MKKFYSLLLSLVVTLSAFALSSNKSKPSRMALPTLTEKAVVHNRANRTLPVQKITKAAVRPAEAPSADDISGDYFWAYYDLRTGEPANTEVTITVDGTTAMVEGILGSVDVEGTFDPATGDITLPTGQILGYSDEYEEYIVFVTVELEGEGEEAVDIPTTNPLILTYTYDEDTDSYYYYSEQCYGVVGRTEDGTYTNADGYYAIAGLAFVEKARPWTPAGTATFYDGGFFGPLFLENGCTPVEVAVEQSPINENIYRLVAPYASAFMEQLNYEFPFNLVFDVTYPDFVMFPEQATTLGFSSLGAAYIVSDGAALVDEYGTDMIEDIMDVYPEIVIALKDGKIEMPIGSIYTIFTGDTENAYYLPEAEGGEPSYIILHPDSGINNVQASDAQGKTEYFNLQGMRVANPTNGLYIERNGSQTKKVIR